jgi:branched-chain amino acid transport system permease protein
MGLSGVQAAQLAPLVYGVVLVAVMLLAPGGVVGIVRGVWKRVGRNQAALGGTPSEHSEQAGAGTPH